jgi:hypothetical protein
VVITDVTMVTLKLCPFLPERAPHFLMFTSSGTINVKVLQIPYGLNCCER